MRIAIVLLVVALAVLAWLFNAEKEKNRDQQDQIRKLTADLADKTKRENMELQEKCAAQAEKMYRSFGYDTKSMGETYQSHYSTTLNKCFMSFESTSVKSDAGNVDEFRSKWLLDAYELKEYAEYQRTTTVDKTYKLTKVESCTLIPAPSAKRACNSEDEYAAFVARYME